MTFLLALLLALAAGPSVSLTVSQQSGPRNVTLHYTVAGPYEGRVCVDIDAPGGEHVSAICADATVSVKAGATTEVSESVYGPAGTFVLKPVLPDTPGEEPMIEGKTLTVVVAPSRSASR